MKLLTSFAVIGLALLSEIQVVLGAPTTTCKTPKHTSTPKYTHTPKHTSKTSKTTAKYASLSLSAKVIITSATFKPLVSPIACPAPTVSLGGGGPFATIQGRMFNIESKTQFFAGTITSASFVCLLVDLSIGTNSWWLSQLQSNADVNTVFSQLALVSSYPRSSSPGHCAKARRLNSWSPACGVSVRPITRLHLRIQTTFRS